MYGLRGDYIAGYTFRADILCPACIVKGTDLENVGSTEMVLNLWAEQKGIDRNDEHTFDSDDFPKVVFASDVTDEDVCGECGEELV